MFLSPRFEQNIDLSAGEDGGRTLQFWWDGYYSSISVKSPPSVKLTQQYLQSFLKYMLYISLNQKPFNLNGKYFSFKREFFFTEILL
jgi:hypothetical protein